MTDTINLQETTMQTFTSTTTSTTDTASGIPLYLRRDGDGYIVTDVVGLRYGWGHFPADALREWAQQVEDILGMTDELADPLKSEVARYRQALDRQVYLS